MTTNLQKSFSWLAPALLVALIAIGPLHYPDSESYLIASFGRQPIYPLLIDLFRTLFGSHFEWPLVAFQLLLGATTIRILSATLAELFGVASPGQLGVALILATPYLSISIPLGNAVLSEGVTYPLFLLAMRALIIGLAEKRDAQIAMYMVLSVLLVLTRKQFLFMFPFALLLLPIIWRRGNVRNTLSLTVLLFTCIATAPLLERTYNYWRHGHFESIASTGRDLLAIPAYVSKDSNAELIRDPETRAVFQTLRGLLRESKADLVSMRDSSHLLQFASTNRFQNFFRNYFNIADAIDKAVNHHFSRQNSAAIDYLVTVDRVTLALSRELIQANFRDYVTVVLLNMSYGLGGHGMGDGYGIRGNYLALLEVLLVVSLLIVSYQNIAMRSKLLVMVALLALHLANVTEVSLMQPALDRYTFYTSTLLTACVFALMWNGLAAIAKSRTTKESGDSVSASQVPAP